MNKFYIHIIFGMVALSFVMGNKGKAMGSAGDSAIMNPTDLIIINDESNDNEVERRRGHKRKRKIRPKRNGF